MKSRLRMGVVLGALTVLAWIGFRWHSAHSARADTIVLRLPPGETLQLAAVRFEPASQVRAARSGAQGWLAIERTAQARALRVRIAGMCPVTAPAGAIAEPIEVKPLIDLGPDLAQVGFDAAFQVSVRLGCVEARAGSISWRQIEGPKLAELHIEVDGQRVRGRTLPLSRVHPEPLPHGIVPFSPGTQGRYVLEATWRGADGATSRRTLRIRSIPRATGVPSVAVSQQVLLGGSGWHVQKAARGGRAQVQAAADHALFAPDVAGRWLLQDAAGEVLSLNAATHDTTPIDCGRAECHASAAESATPTAMSHALERRFAGAPQPSAALACTLECHTVGEPGLADGGFIDMARALDFRWSHALRWDELPQPLRRFGGVRCTSCHGPGAIPEPSSRWKILASDVCAHCHDAPPRYSHVAQWRSSRMARSDLEPATRDQPACARCHTSGGFLAALGVRPQAQIKEATGIACAACHAPHAPRHAAALLREVPEPQALGGATSALEASSRLCASCHAPLEQAPTPGASAAALWAGRVRVPSGAAAGAWELMSGVTPHGAVPRGCVGCHGAAAAATPGARTDHGFRVDRATCAACHAAGVPLADSQLQVRARELEAALVARCAQAGRPHADRPAHAAGGGERCASAALERARYELHLVLEDPAAWAHNAAFTRALLDDVAARLVE